MSQLISNQTFNLERRHESNATGIVVAAACLLTVGVVMVASAGANLDEPVITWQFWKSLFGRQAIFSGASLVAILIVAHGFHRLFAWRPGSWIQPALGFYLATAGILAAVLVPGIGVMRKGARRWMQVGPESLGLSFQPSELAKLAIVVFLAAFLSSSTDRIRSFWKGLVPSCAAIGIIVSLVGKEDFGTGALLALVGGMMVVVAGAKWRHLMIFAIPAVSGLVYLVLSRPYRVERLMVFRNIWADPQGAGYHPVQSLVTIASGGLFGRGLGSGVQKYGYLPESRSDFIFSVICEEAGMVGALIVISLFLLLMWFGWRTVRLSHTTYGRLLAFGVTSMFVFQALINIAVVTVCAPTKGISLPLISAGGSGVLFLGVALGLLVSVARDCPDVSDDSQVSSELAAQEAS
ncbi:MAG: FtsW/RodA/SpoVE family cell cycle protein [Phycisphaerales bacterium]|nr:FtsW/RodA/SpoVE family cell cycle protein [Phycisphaerales bacterium]